MTSNQACWAQTIYWPFMHVSQYGRGTVLQPLVNAPLYSSTDFDDVPFIDSAAVLGDDGSLNIFVLNRSIDSNIELSCDLRAFGKISFKEQIVLHHDDGKAINSEANADEVAPVVCHHYKAENGKFSIPLPALSWNVLKFSDQA
jgi:alpha-N-arabinofuranosidase